MGKTKIAITLAEKTVKYLDHLVEEQVFSNRSQAIQQAVDEKIERMGRDRLARECAKLDPAEEKGLAEEGLAEDLSKWPEY
jgi:metal-responsive CopG/Arc/MetJ family transcriptional regulator